MSPVPVLTGPCSVDILEDFGGRQSEPRTERVFERSKRERTAYSARRLAPCAAQLNARFPGFQQDTRAL
jgi:hypothetical protein